MLLRISTAVKFFKFCWAVVVGVSPICCFLLSLREVVLVGYGMAAVASLVAKYWWCSFSLVVVDSFLLYDHGCGVSFFSISGSLLVGNSIDCGTLGHP